MTAMEKEEILQGGVNTCMTLEMWVQVHPFVTSHKTRSSRSVFGFFCCTDNDSGKETLGNVERFLNLQFILMVRGTV